ncbi:MAG: DUF2851 family protein [Muribaculaceae bacterium]|nr:DUF2851 family protein [Muribaculaceae bacterium]
MERLMQYVWKHRLLLHTDLVTVDGRRVSVLDPGVHNLDAGPDFFNAKVRIGDSVWAGDVEIHVRASDWHRHGHDGNPAYDSVVLHVVDRDDVPVCRSNGEVIPQMVMQCHPDFHNRYSQLVERADIDLPCACELAELPTLHLTDWVTSMALERIHSKADRLRALADRFTGDMEEATYVTLARALGFGTNAEPMERLALSLPLMFLRKHADSLTSIEALLFGQAGFLDQAPGGDPYVEQLRREYQFLNHKFSLRRPETLGWKMGRMRPANFPHRRIAMLASIIHDDFRPVAGMIDAASPDDIIERFRRPLPPYWTTRHTFGPSSGRAIETLSRASAAGIVINVAVPLLAAVGSMRGDDTLLTRAIDWLQALPGESNRIVTGFSHAGVRVRDAFMSQALIHVRRNYCEPRKCLYCRIGHRLLASRARR